MEKNGKVQLHKTPSSLTSKPCVRIEEGEPLAADEILPEKSMKKLAKQLGGEIQRGNRPR